MKLSALALVLLLTGLSGSAASIEYTKIFPGSYPEYVAITVTEDGQVSYKESADEEPVEFTLDESARAEIFALAERLDHFSSDLESGLKVASMGEKTFRWVDEAGTTEARFNHTSQPAAMALQDYFQRITESEQLFFALDRAIRYDRLGVHDAITGIDAAWRKDRLVATGQLLPLMKRVQENEVYLHMARELAATLIEEIEKGSGE